MTRSDGSIGTLVIPSLGIRYKAYEGTDSATMHKGVGHFPSTSAWNGNIGLCGHNRGSRHSIGSIKDLKVGDTIQYETSSGTRTYSGGDLLFTERILYHSSHFMRRKVIFELFMNTSLSPGRKPVS